MTGPALPPADDHGAVDVPPGVLGPAAVDDAAPATAAASAAAADGTVARALRYVLVAAVMLGIGYASGRAVARWRTAAPGQPRAAAGSGSAGAPALAGAGGLAGGQGRAAGEAEAVPSAEDLAAAAAAAAGAGDGSASAPDTGGLSVGVIDAGMANLGDIAPTFRLPGPEPGTTVDLADHAGKAILLNFWATWCVPCRHEMPFLQALHEAHAERGDLAVVAIDVDETASEVAPYLAELGLTFPVGLDGDGLVADQYRIGTYPTTYLVGRDGRIMSVKRGAYGTPFELEQAASLMLRP